MERWSGRVAVVTGASGGIGRAIVRVLVNKGLKVVGLDCAAVDSEFSDSLQDAPGKFYSIVTDLTKEDEILSAFSWVKEHLEGVDILANVAGVCLVDKLSEGVTSDWRRMLDVNVLALSICTREALKSMRERGVDDGHIVHIGSINGVRVLDNVILSMYAASKHAVRSLTEGLRKELNQLRSRIRVSIINPGSVRTAMAATALTEEMLNTIPMMEAEDMADIVVYLLSTPLRVQVHEVIVQPNEIYVDCHVASSKTLVCNYGWQRYINTLKIKSIFLVKIIDFYHSCSSRSAGMERWGGKVAVVTGASGGMGTAAVRALVRRGLSVVGLDRQPFDDQIANSLHNAKGKLFTITTDVTKEEDILSAFGWVKDNLGGVDILINTAGVCHRSKLSEGDTAVWRRMLDVNVLALSICTREALKSMRERGVDDGHIVHIGSIAGHFVPNSTGAGIYTASKHAVTTLAEALRRELNLLNMPIKITNISPGGVRTNLIAGIVPEERLKSMPLMEPEDIADAIIYTLSTPPRVKVHEIIIRPNGEA
ncbi:uncharacterized short-chain type dehydrogenase/reductase y4vI-like [Bacillus rossius redtenbacheri]|uniref:uncharacterized short-chain type dehydrogenase/reductase y4vI-like n=1 Tax=Bacillus rossius redtenbacheri TaxID=93214 RepID=UPI002FDDC320